MPRERSASIDAVRVLGIIAVVAGHVWGGELARSLIYTWQVPVFFFLSGYLWSPGRSLGAEVRNRWRTLGKPYLFWIVCIGTVFVSWLAFKAQLTSDIPLRILAGGNYIGRPLSAFWFMSALFAACILFRLLDRWPWVIAALGGVGLVAAELASKVVASVPLSLAVAVPALAFMIAGYGLRRVQPRIPHPPLVAALALAVAFALVATGASAPLDMKQADFGTPVVSVASAILICGSLLLLADALVPRLNEPTQRAFVALAACGTMVILSHAVILWALDTPPDGNLVDFVLSLTLPWIAALVAARTPLSSLLIGTSTRPRSGQALP